MKNIFVIFVVFFNIVIQAQEPLLYANYIDYYRESVKSTILTKEGKFLKDGKYKFTGSPKDFRFLLSFILRYDIDDFKSSDTLIFEGEIKDSIKVNIWHLITKRNGKPLDLIYHKQKNSTLTGMNFNSNYNKDGLSNEKIFLKIYDKNEYLSFSKVGGMINSYYYFGDKNIYISKNEHYYKNNILISNFYVLNKKDNKTIYSEKSNGIRESVDKKKKIEDKNSFYQCNDSCWIEIKTTTIINKKNKIDKYIWQQIDYNEKLQDKEDGDIIVLGKRKYIGVNVGEGIKNDKLVELKFKFDNIETNCSFSEILKTNYYPIILYEKTFNL